MNTANSVVVALTVLASFIVGVAFCVAILVVGFSWLGCTLDSVQPQSSFSAKQGDVRDNTSVLEKIDRETFLLIEGASSG